MRAPGERQLGWGSVLRGLLYMRICELTTRRSIARLVLSFFVVFALLAVTKLEGDATEVRFWEVALGMFALGFLPLYCLVKGGDSLRGALREGTIEYLWTRPTSRAALFIGFFLSSLIGIGAFAGSCVLAICCAGVYLGAIESLGEVLLYAGGCGFAVLAFSAIASGLSALTSRFVVFGVLYYSFVEGLLGQMPTGARNVSGLVHLRSALRPLQDGSISLLSSSVVQSALALVVLAGVALVVGATLFTMRNYAVGSDK